MCAAPHIRKKPSLPGEPPAEGQTRQIYRQSRDDDRSELKIFLCSSHLVARMTLKPGQSLWLQERGHSSSGHSTVPPLRHMEKAYLPRLTPMDMSPEPRLAPMTSLLQPAKAKRCPGVQAAQVSAVHGTGYLVLSVSDRMWAGEEFLQGREGIGQGSSLRSCRSMASRFHRL